MPRVAGTIVTAVLLGALARSASPIRAQISGPSDSGERPAASAALPSEPQIDAAVIAGPLWRLGSADFDERRRATEALENFGAGAFDALKAAYRSTDDFEVRLRISDIVEKSFIREQLRVRGQSGFLGIQLMQVGPAQDPRIPAGQGGISVSRVVPDSAAERAGVQLGDVIVSLDGSPVEEPTVGDPNNTKFREQIRATAPGTRRRLEVLRKGEQRIPIDVTVGERPPDQYLQDPYMRAEREEIQRKFVSFWSEEFVPSDPAAAAAATPQRIELDPVRPAP